MSHSVKSIRVALLLLILIVVVGDSAWARHLTVRHYAVRQYAVRRVYFGHARQMSVTTCERSSSGQSAGCRDASVSCAAQEKDAGGKESDGPMHKHPVLFNGPSPIAGDITHYDPVNDEETATYQVVEPTEVRRLHEFMSAHATQRATLAMPNIPDVFVRFKYQDGSHHTVSFGPVGNFLIDDDFSGQLTDKQFADLNRMLRAVTRSK